MPPAGDQRHPGASRPPPRITAGVPAGVDAWIGLALALAGLSCSDPQPLESGANSAPVVQILAPGDNSSLPLLADTAIVASAEDSDGRIQRVEFFDGPTSLGQVGAAPFRLRWIPAAPGVRSLTARAVDDRGASAISSPVHITVLDASPQVVLTAPAAGSNLVLGTPVSVAAAATDPDGTVAEVMFFDGSAPIGIDSTTPFEVTWTPATAGTRMLTAIATDNFGAVSVSPPVAVTVTGPNAPPVVALTAPAPGASFLVNTVVQVTATAADPDGTVAKVEFFDGATLLGSDNAAPYAQAWTPTTTGGHTLTAVATDNAGAVSVSPAVAVTVTGPNAPPVVALTAPAPGASLPLGLPVTLGATASDTDGIIALVEFFDGAALLGQDATPPFGLSWVPATPGQHSLTARATDNLGAGTTSVGVTVNVINAAPTVALTSPLAGTSFLVNAVVQLAAAASDPDGTVTKVDFLDGATPLGSDNAAPFVLAWTPTTTGGHTLTAVATDNFGLTATSAAVAVTVTALNLPPTVTLTAPPVGAELPVNVATTLTATAADADGNIVAVEFFDGAVPLGTDSATPFALSWVPSVAGSHSLSARAVDNQGAVTSSAPVAVTVTAPNQLPTVVLTAPAAGMRLALNVPVTLTATAADPDGRVTLVEFLDGATLLGSDATAPHGVAWTPTAPGPHTLSARATDDSGATALSAPVGVTVNSPPSVTLVSPVSGATLAVGVPVSLTAEAADVDGTVAAVRFFDGVTVLATLTGPPFAFTWTPTTLGGHTLSVEATDNEGAITTSGSVPVSVTGTVVASILTPLAGTTYRGGDTIHFSGTGTDAGGSPLPGTSLTWWAELHHDTHTHPFMPATPGASGSVEIPTSGEVSANVFYRLYLRAVEASGLADTVFRDILPETVQLTVTSVPVGRTITLDGQPHVAPYTVTAVMGIQREVGAPSPQSGGDSTYTFQSWSDAGSQTHLISTPAANTTFTATFLATGPANQPPTVSLTAPASGSSVVVNTPVTISATAADGDGTVQQVQFFDGIALVGSDATSPYGVTWTPTVLGPRSLTARATDDDGATTTSVAVAVEVISGGGGDTQAPTVTLTAPTDGERDLTGVITATADATDNVGVVAVEFQLDGQTIGEATSAPYQIALPNTAGFTTGVHQVRARARDAAGNRSGWQVARVTFGGNVDQPAGFTRTAFVQDLGTLGTAMAFAPDGRLFICEQGGDLRVVKNGALLGTPFVHVPTVVNGERGLLGVAFDQDFASNRFVYVYYTVTNEDGVSHNRISRFTADGDAAVAGSELPLVDLPALSDFNGHNGGALHFGPDGRLYVAVGDNGTGSNAQSTSSRFGKILRYNSDGTIPSDNPGVGTGDPANAAIWAMGLRNPFTFGFQPGTGRLFINDVGESSWEEINQGAAGANYGWPVTEGATSNPAFTGPLFAYRHAGSPESDPTRVLGEAIVGAAFYNPATVLFPGPYVGSYFFADYVEQWINRLDLATGNDAVYAFARLPGPVTDVTVGPDGALYVLGVQGNGSWGVWRLGR